MNQYTDEKTSKQLKEWGCELETYTVYIHGTDFGIKRADDLYNQVNTYDLLWDVCIKYPQEFFGVKYIKYTCMGDRETSEETTSEDYEQNYKKSQRDYEDYLFGTRKKPLIYHHYSTRCLNGANPTCIFRLLQQNKYKEANEYLLENTIFNPKNK